MRNLVASLVKARRNGTADADGPTPASVAEGYAVQEAVAASLGQQAVGWKVGSHPVYGAISAPMLSAGVHKSPTTIQLEPGLALEVEIGLTLNRPLRTGAETRASVIEAIASSGLGIELVRSRFARGGDSPFLSQLADDLSHAGYVATSFTPGWHEEALAGLQCRVMHGTKVLFDGPCPHGAGDPLLWLVDYANAPLKTFNGPQPGDIITTGALCGPLALPGPGKVSISLAGFGTAEIVFA